jgi:DNA-binding NtrC family response regulator
MKPKKSVLIVDDEASVREALRQILKPDYEVHTAADGDEALQCIRRERIDLVTLDLKMPKMSGIEVLREIKKIREDVEVIIITAYGNPDNAGEALYYGAGDFIAKPFDVSDVTAKVNQSFERQYHGVKIKNLIKHINALLPRGEKGKEERLLALSKNLCEILEKGDSSSPAGTEEVLNSTPPV